jgi:hypothetical protein
MELFFFFSNLLLVVFAFFGIISFLIFMGALLASNDAFVWETRFEFFDYEVFLRFSKATPLVLNMGKKQLR